MGYGTPFPNVVHDSQHLCAIARLLINDTQRLLQTIDTLEPACAASRAPLTTWWRREAAPQASGPFPLVLARRRD
jgi:hypothetical protein